MDVCANRLTKSDSRQQAVNRRMAPRDGFEPPAKRLTVACSTAELPGNKPCGTVIHNKSRYASLFCYKSVLAAGLFDLSVPMLADFLVSRCASRSISAVHRVVADITPASLALRALPER